MFRCGNAIQKGHRQRWVAQVFAPGLEVYIGGQGGGALRATGVDYLIEEAGRLGAYAALNAVESEFINDCREAQESPAKENSFRRYRLNQWTQQEVRWLSMEKWDACGATVGDLRGRDCCAGLDLSSTTDLSALVLVFIGDARYEVLPFF